MCSTCGERPSTSAFRCSTPKRCCSSITATARRGSSIPSWMSACVPTSTSASPSCFTEPVRSATRTPSCAHKDSTVRKCCSASVSVRSEEHTSELQSHSDLVCRLLLEKKKKKIKKKEKKKKKKKKKKKTKKKKKKQR